MANNSSIIGKIAWAVFVSLLIFGVISAITTIGTKELAGQFQENPKATGINFFIFSQAYGSISPYWEIFDGKIQIPYPDATDIFGLLFFAIIAIIIIQLTGLRNNRVASVLVFLLFLFFGWFMWKIMMYYLYLWTGGYFGLTYEQLAQLRLGGQARAERVGLIPLLVLSLFTFIATIKLIPRPN